jgi:hypothetical protein
MGEGGTGAPRGRVRFTIASSSNTPAATTFLSLSWRAYLRTRSRCEDEEVADAMLWGLAESRREGALAEKEVEEA